MQLTGHFLPAGNGAFRLLLHLISTYDRNICTNQKHALPQARHHVFAVFAFGASGMAAKKKAKSRAKYAPEEARRRSNRKLAPHAWKPGQSGNPSGRPKGSLRRDDVEALFGRLCSFTRDELRAVMRDESSTVLEVMIASIVFEGVKDGDYSRLDFLLNRSIGRVKEVQRVEHDGPAPQIIVNLPSNGREVKAS